MNSATTPSESPNLDRQLRGNVIVLAIAWFTVLVAIDVHAAGGAGVGGAILALTVRGLIGMKRFRWWQIVLIALAALAAALLVYLLVAVAIVLIRKH